MSGERRFVYCAGPLFTVKEREEMQEFAAAIENAGFSTFLPHRDGLEFAKCCEALTKKDINVQEATSIVSRAIFALDVYQVVVACDAIAVNLNGRVPDEGAVSEAALAWCTGKIVVGYKADSRSVFMGQENPLVSGLFGFKLHGSITEAVEAVRRGFEALPSGKQRAEIRGRQINEYLDLGAKIWRALSKRIEVEEIAKIFRETSSEFHAPSPVTVFSTLAEG